MLSKVGDLNNLSNLQALKSKLLIEIELYQYEIEEAHNKSRKLNEIEFDESSDSDTELPIQFETGLSVVQLQQDRDKLQTCLQATQELTNLEILQSEVNLLAENPNFEGESPVSEKGTWREVVAECCIGLVPFSITFFTHTADRKFGFTSYRNLRVWPVKSAHEAELANSVLPELKRPSDAVEPEGGYLLKCEMLEICWTLQNKWSPIAPFHHRLKFDVEYMDESYIKTIAACHRQLSDPNVATDERTHLLSQIIDTCLLGRAESEASEHDAGLVRGRRTTLDREPEMPIIRPQHTEVMAPPRYVPKKSKRYTKSDAGERRDTTNVPEIQKEKVSEKKTKSVDIFSNHKGVDLNKLVEKFDQNANKKVGNEKNTEKRNLKQSTAENDEAGVKKAKYSKTKETTNDNNSAKNKNVDQYKNKDATNKGKEDSDTKNTEKNVPNTKTKTAKVATIKKNEQTKVTKEGSVKKIASKNDIVSKDGAGRPEDNNIKNNDAVASNKETNIASVSESAKTPKIVKPVVKKVNRTPGKVVKKVVRNDAQKVVAKLTKVANENGKTKVKENVAGDKKTKENTKMAETEMPAKKISVKPKNLTGQVIKNVVNSNIAKVKDPTLRKLSPAKNDEKPKNLALKSMNKPKGGNTAGLNKVTSNTEKENKDMNTLKTSKIPQKKFPSVLDGKKVQARVSPRKLVMKSKNSPQVPTFKPKPKSSLAQQAATNIPRLQTKQKPKVM